ncbi:MAG: selenocysteine-specific translation elongation factor [Clostridia bacterium]|nr:selenocysteine-specific translation elongation factor [Clostridia bacterium]
MKNVIVGTAGHVDHGKTFLIKALTGMDCDRLKEEKKRGITIENGFADMIYGDYNISVIDVPGHEKFVSNMLAGIGGIDLVLLVIGLDEGVMPQTREHFGILDKLDIRKGIIVYTKRDLVDDPDWIEMVRDDARDLVKGTFMEDAPEIEVSSLDGYNIDKLRDLIIENIDDDLLKNSSEFLFRLPVDRVFTIDGFGTVITGTLVEGRVKTGDEIMVYPEKKLTKVRNVQVHNENVDEALAGQRTALNLQGLKKDDLRRGSVLAKPGSLETGRLLDVRLEMLRDTDRKILNNARVHFYSGSTESLAKVILLDRDAAEKGDVCYCQLKLEEDVAVKRNDRFIVRFFSPMITVGGGKILEVTPRKHKRFDEDALEGLRIKDQGSEKEIMDLVLSEKSREVPDVTRLALKQRLTMDETQNILAELVSGKRARALEKGRYIHESFLSRAKESAAEILGDYHENNRMSVGMARAEFRSRLGEKLRLEDSKALDEIIAMMTADKVIKEVSGRVSAFGFGVKRSPEAEKLRNRVLGRYRQSVYEMPTVDEILETERDKVNARHLIDSLVDEGELVRLDARYCIDSGAYEKALNMIKEHITNNGKITLAEFRDMIGTSRKYAMAILDHTDRERITAKEGDYRILR